MNNPFGTNGIRGKWNELNPEYAFKLARSFAYYVKEKGINKIFIGRDGRLTSEPLYYAVKSGIMAGGGNAVDCHQVSTPTLEFISKNNAGIMITASHNPPEWNGLKFILEYPLPKEEGENVLRYFDKGNMNWNFVGSSKPLNPIPLYIEELLKNTKIKNKHKIILDFGNGVVANYANLFKKVAEPEAINDNVDGLFPGRPSEPTENNLSLLKNLVEDYEVGFAWDGDGDRVVMFDEKGNFINGDKTLALAVLLKKDKIKEVITTVATSKVVEKTAEKYGIKTKYTKVGVPYLAMSLKEGAIAGEESGGVIWNEISKAKDGIETALKILSMLDEKPLSEWLKELPDYYIEKTKVNLDNKEEKMVKIKEYLKDKEPILIDGVKLDFGDEWVIIRPSGTENYIRIFAEARTKERAERLVNEYKKLVLEI